MQNSERVTPMALLLFCMIFPAFSAWLYFVAYTDGALVQRLYSSPKALQFLVPLVWIYFCRKQRLRFRRPKLRDLLVGTISGLGLLGIVLLSYFWILRGSPLLSAAPQAISAKLDALGAGTVSGFVL